MITAEDAVRQRNAYRSLVHASSVPQIKILARRSWVEWRYACVLLEDLGDDYGVMLYCELVPGTVVVDVRERDCMLVRKMENGGQSSLHLESPDHQRPVYQNYVGVTSPVVVLAMPVTVPDDPPGPWIPGENGDPIPTPDTSMSTAEMIAADRRAAVQDYQEAQP